MSMDEIRSTLFSAKLRRLLAEALQRGERVLWQGQPDGVADMMMWRFLWWIGFPWLALAVVATAKGWIDQSAMFFLLSGVMMIAAPLVMLLYDWQTLCVITNRRALIVRTAWGKPDRDRHLVQGHGRDIRDPRHRPRRRPPEFRVRHFAPCRPIPITPAVTGFVAFETPPRCAIFSSARVAEHAARLAGLSPGLRSRLMEPEASSS